MIRNADDLAAWLETAALKRKCITGSSPWKPTRQARGCVVYESEEIEALENFLADAPRTPAGHPTADAKRNMAARPYGLFSLRQTWDTNEWADYSLLSLQSEQIGLGIGVRQWDAKFYPTANVNEVAASLARGATAIGLKTLIFVGTRVAAGSVAKKLNKLTFTG
jgi:hypothetical protein